MIMGNKFLDKQGLATFLAQSKELFATDDAVTEVKTTTDNYVLNVDYTPLRFDTSEIVSGGSAGGGGGAECSGNHIIEVDTLPTENIDENALYKVGESYYKYARELKDIIIVDSDTPYSLVDSYMSYGATFELYYVKTRPSSGNVSSALADGFGFACYYVEDENNILVYGDLEGSGTNSWIPVASLLERPNGGAITDISQATTNTAMYALVENGWKTYVRMNGTISKGQIIKMNLDGKNRQYRILKSNGMIAECLAMFITDEATVFDEDGLNIYEGSELDTFLNTTWYGELNDAAKAAIVPKTFTQDSWYDGNSGNPIYSGYYGETNTGTTPYTISRGDTAYGSSITRNVYALSVQDVLDYVLDTTVGDGLLQNYNIWKMFWNIEESPSYSASPYLRSAFANNGIYGWGVNDNSGYIKRTDNLINSRRVQPAFTIDLSKIEWDVVE